METEQPHETTLKQAIKESTALAFAKLLIPGTIALLGLAGYVEARKEMSRYELAQPVKAVVSVLDQGEKMYTHRGEKFSLKRTCNDEICTITGTIPLGEYTLFLEDKGSSGLRNDDTIKIRPQRILWHHNRIPSTRMGELSWNVQTAIRESYGRAAKTITRCEGIQTESTGFVERVDPINEAYRSTPVEIGRAIEISRAREEQFEHSSLDARLARAAKTYTCK